MPERNQKPVTIRLTEDEHKLLRERAGEEPVSVYIRRAALAFGAERDEPPADASLPSDPPPLPSPPPPGPQTEATGEEPESADGETRDEFIARRSKELEAENIHPMRVRDLAEAEWESIQREET